MVAKWIYVKKKRFFLYGIYNTDKEAHQIAKRHRKKNKCRYFIQAYDSMGLFPRKKHALYLDKCIGLW